MSKGSQVKIVLHVIFLTPNITKTGFFVRRELRSRTGPKEKQRHKLVEDGIGPWRPRWSHASNGNA